MYNSTKNKDEILQAVRQGLRTTTPLPFPDERGQISEVLVAPDEDLAFSFAQNLMEANGKFVYCESAKDAAASIKELIQTQQWRHLYVWERDIQEFLERNDIRERRIGKQLDRAEVGITTCDALIARTGSILISSRSASGRSLSIFPPVHIVLAHQKQLCADISDALQMAQATSLRNSASMYSIVTGASRTADSENTSVIGAHGSKELYVFFIDK